MSSLKNQIYKVRPDLFNFVKPEGFPIPDQPKIKTKDLTQSMLYFII